MKKIFMRLRFGNKRIRQSFIEDGRDGLRS